MQRWNFLSNSYVELQDNGNMTFVGNIANEIMHMMDKRLRDMGIDINKHGMNVYNAARIDLLNASEIAVNNIYNETILNQLEGVK